MLGWGLIAVVKCLIPDALQEILRVAKRSRPHVVGGIYCQAACFFNALPSRGREENAASALVVHRGGGAKGKREKLQSAPPLQLCIQARDGTFKVPHAALQEKKLSGAGLQKPPLTKKPQQGRRRSGGCKQEQRAAQGLWAAWGRVAARQ